RGGVRPSVFAAVITLGTAVDAPRQLPAQATATDTVGSCWSYQTPGYLIRETLTAMAARLLPPRFVRIHRSTIVNVEHIRALEPMPNREYLVVLRSGVRLRSSRSYDDALRLLLEATSHRAEGQGRGVR
ncbi:MAG: LytTr DNA-binding region, partial [Gemmatimonadetes bacterium]|nr:LytTr DNA-binding region [Gemmatimonadota bacterium]